MKGGKAGRGRKTSGARAGGKGPARGAKKGVAKRGNKPVAKTEKRTTRLGAVRVPDDA